MVNIFLNVDRFKLHAQIIAHSYKCDMGICTTCPHSNILLIFRERLASRMAGKLSSTLNYFPQFNFQITPETLVIQSKVNFTCYLSGTVAHVERAITWIQNLNAIIISLYFPFSPTVAII